MMAVGLNIHFWEAIHNDYALILHRRWLESHHRDFRENYNCLVVENENELADLIRKDPDSTMLVHNAKKLMDRHTNINWAQLIISASKH